MEANSKTVMMAVEKRISKLEQNKLLIEDKVAATGAPRQPFDKMFELACMFLASPCKDWDTDRFKLLRLVFKLTPAGRVENCKAEGF